MTSLQGKTVAVVVIGDIGRSPRIRNQAMSLAAQGAKVKMIGYLDWYKFPMEFCYENRITFVGLWPFPGFIAYFLPPILGLIIETLWLSWQLLWCLWTPRSFSPFAFFPDMILVQNPPTIPTLPICWFYAKISSIFKRCPFVIDWHNYGFSILALSPSKSTKRLLPVAKRIESFFGSRSDAGFCVSNAMKTDLAATANCYQDWKSVSIPADVLIDRPYRQCMTPNFSMENKSAVFNHWARKVPDSCHYPGPNKNANVFTKVNVQHQWVWRPDRPGLVISSTSWTEDEDFGILLKACEVYNAMYEQANTDQADPARRLPHLVVAITGTGPMRAFYKKQIATLNLAHVKFLTPWLENDEYPTMMAAADLGVCLHTSSSGLDLPVKIVDMFSGGLPVAAVDFPTIRELVRPGENGTIFTTHQELAEQMAEWFRGFPASHNNPQGRQAEMRRTVTAWSAVRWQTYWNETALPVIAGLYEKKDQ